jgi:hypothetical protein
MTAPFDFDAAYAAAAPRTVNLADYGAERFIGSPPPVCWLVEGSIPLGVPVLLAAMGDTGKSFVALNACYHVAVPPPKPTGNLNFNAIRKILGGEVVAHGTAVFITAEDNDAAIHRRLTAIDPFECRRQHPGKLITVALPSAGGPMPFFVRDHNGVMVADEWKMICDQLIKIKDLKLVGFDPLANFAQVALDTDSSDAQFVTSQFGSLAAETGATVLLPHHMRKTSKAPVNVAEAREAIRGSSGIVDGVRLAYALWPVDEADGKQVCRALQIPFLLNRVVKRGRRQSQRVRQPRDHDLRAIGQRPADRSHRRAACDQAGHGTPDGCPRGGRCGRGGERASIHPAWAFGAVRAARAPASKSQRGRQGQARKALPRADRRRQDRAVHGHRLAHRQMA